MRGVYMRTVNRMTALDDAEQLQDDEAALESQVMQRLDIARVSHALAALPVERAQVVALRYFADLSTREIAVLMRKSEPNVRQLLSRALRELRAALREEDDDA
jgi:RNA polymerase sigma factor (sigma-70 family)